MHKATKRHCKYTGKLTGYYYRGMTIDKRKDYFQPFQVQSGLFGREKYGFRVMRFRRMRDAKDFIDRMQDN